VEIFPTTLDCEQLICKVRIISNEFVIHSKRSIIAKCQENVPHSQQITTHLSVAADQWKAIGRVTSQVTHELKQLR